MLKLIKKCFAMDSTSERKRMTNVANTHIYRENNSFYLDTNKNQYLRNLFKDWPQHGVNNDISLLEYREKLNNHLKKHNK